MIWHDLARSGHIRPVKRTVRQFRNNLLSHACWVALAGRTLQKIDQLLHITNHAVPTFALRAKFQ